MIPPRGFAAASCGEPAILEHSLATILYPPLARSQAPIRSNIHGKHSPVEILLDVSGELLSYWEFCNQAIKPCAGPLLT